MLLREVSIPENMKTEGIFWLRCMDASKLRCLRSNQAWIM